MADTTGKVACVRVGDEAGFTAVVEQSTNTRETFILWWDGVSTPANPAARTRIAQSNWVGLLRQAIANNTTVTINHATNSSIVLNVQIGQ